MLSLLRRWAPLGLLMLSLGVEQSAGHKQEAELNATTVIDPTCTGNVTVLYTTTIVSSTIEEVTHYVNVTVSNTEYRTTTLHVAVNVTETDSTTVTTTGTAATTTTLHFNVAETETESTTVTTTGTAATTVTTTGTAATTVTTTGTAATTVTTTGTAATTVTTTGTAATTVTTTGTAATTVTTTGTVPATITTFTTQTQTQTVFTTTYEPCPKTCSISAGTVTVFYWPTNRPYTYPPTYVDPELGYTFTSPSVYLLIPTAKGTNSLGQPFGPSTTSWVLGLDLYDVSTIAEGSITRQLTLSDLGTDCPRTVDPTAIATLPQSCNPILAAPRQVSSWAYPCNACGRFGLFDPPYAVPTLTGPLVQTTIPPVTVTATPAPVTTTPPPPPTSAPPVGILEIVYYSDGTPVATATVTSTGITGTVRSTVNVPATPKNTAASSAVTVDPATTKSAAASTSSRASSPATTAPATVATSPATTPSTVKTASATRPTVGLTWAVLAVFLAVFLM